jgi:hypothetical protein
MTKFENSWGIHMREDLAENSLSQLEGRWRGRGRSVYKASCEGIMTHMEVAGGYVFRHICPPA